MSLVAIVLQAAQQAVQPGTSDVPIASNELTAVILATAALGTAAFGIVEALKWTPLGEAGFGALMKLLGNLEKTFAVAFGAAPERMLRAQYRGDTKDLARLLRQAVRVGLTDTNAAAIATSLGTVDPVKLQEAVVAAEAGTELSPELRNVLGRYEVAADARIDAGLTKAQSVYSNTARVAASIVALGIGWGVGLRMDRGLAGFLVGISAVPLAPVANDLVAALQAATKALGRKG